jgi:hypothetical protein
MSDVVERLRAWKSPWRGDGDESAIPLAAEAADEIERLREALVKCQWELETIDRTQSTNYRRVQELILANRAALKGNQ